MIKHVSEGAAMSKTTKPDAVAPIPDDLRAMYNNLGVIVDLSGEGGRMLIERIAQAEQRVEKAQTLCVEYSNRIDTADKVVAEKNETIAKAEAENTRLREALKSINRMSSPGNRTLDDFIRDISYINFSALAALNPPTSAKEE